MNNPSESGDKKIDPSLIKSFIRRQGRATAGQKQALDQHAERYCLQPAAAFNAEAVFGRAAPLVVEIGFGNGASLAAMAQARPDWDFLGIEVHRPGVGHLLMLIEQMGLENVRIYHHDALEILEQRIADHSLQGVHLFFPDPWHKVGRGRLFSRGDGLAGICKSHAGRIIRNPSIGQPQCGR
jgi:tRNA (guanine-N7-)-methyltransferase